MNRRIFLQRTLAVGAGACFAGPLQALETSQRASVIDFGADSTGRKDSTDAVRRAIASLSKTSARIVFPAGKYAFDASSEAVMLFENFDGIEIYANNAELQFNGMSNLFAFAACHDIALHDMKLTWTGAPAKEPNPDRETQCLSFRQCETVLLEGVAIQRAPGTGIGLSDCRDLHLENVTVAPAKDSRLPASCESHAISIGNCHGDVKISESCFEGMGGDGIHVYQSYWRIRERLDERSVVIESIHKGPLEKGQLPSPGSFVQFSSPDTLLLLGEIEINSVSPNAQGATLKFSETLSPVILSGMLVCSVVDGPKVVIDHCRIGSNAGRGAVLRARSEVTNNHFHDCGGAAILLSPDVQRMEGPVVQTINIRTNTFEACDKRVVGAGNSESMSGVITIDTAMDRERAVTPAYMVNSGIKIQSNIFRNTTGAAIYAAGVDGLLVDGNTFGSRKSVQGPVTAALILRNVADANVTGNTASKPQSIVLMQCADSVTTDGNRMLTAENSA